MGMRKDQEEDEKLWGLRPLRWVLRMFKLEGRALAASLSLDKALQIATLLELELTFPVKVDELTEALLLAVEQRRESLLCQRERSNRLQRNLALLKRAIGLNAVELDLVAFRALLRLHPCFEELAGKYIRPCTDFVFHRRLAALFEVSRHAIERALDPRGRLVQSGLATVNLGTMGPLEDRFRLKQGLISPLLGCHKTPADLLSSLLPRTRQPQLRLVDYPHLSREVRLLHDFLRMAVDQRRAGTNVLLHGAPGTGKSELVAAMAVSLRYKLYEVPTMHDYGPALTPRERLSEIGQSQRIVRLVGSGLLLVDEAEDLFPTVWSDSEKTPTKAAVNECLERNPTPTIWISNRTRHMDEAFLRRFDLVIHVPPLPSLAKETLLRRSLPTDTLEQCELRRYAMQRELSPAMIARLALVATSGADERPKQVRENFSMLSRHYLHTLGARPLPLSEYAFGLDHDLALLNTDPPLDSLLAGITRVKIGARLLLHGPPGTGKTAFGKALAEKLDKPLLQHQASSLLSCYVGETEKNLREMFDEAIRENGVLLLDEADGFLRTRDGARTRWEVTQVNEMLTQMETFEGIFVCTTNRLDDLDPAALRRFDFKVEFRPLRHDQRFRLFRQCAKLLGLNEHDLDEAVLTTRLRPLDSLTPGDAAAVLRRLRISDEAVPTDALIAALADECRYRPHSSKPMGFVH